MYKGGLYVNDKINAMIRKLNFFIEKSNIKLKQMSFRVQGFVSHRFTAEINNPSAY